MAFLVYFCGIIWKTNRDWLANVAEKLLPRVNPHFLFRPRRPCRIPQKKQILLFNSLPFFIFLPIVFCLYWVSRTARWQNVVLLAASCVFYGCWSVEFLGLMLVTCLVNFVVTQGIERWRRKVWVVGALVFNFSILGVFKYYDFFAESFAALLARFGMYADIPTLKLLLPVGISFYTFQLSAYVIDCYKGRIAPTRSPLQFLTFVCFFPQLVAGPIERGADLMPQFERKRKFDDALATEGMRLILWGLVKKVLIADNCAFQADYCFANCTTLSAPTLWLGALYFTFQIYCDFSGYCDIAVGTARLFGVRISANFLRPYFATSMPDFWRRWHVTLMQWFRDYVYIPLGGNRRGTARRELNTLAVFACSGLWHGAGWTYILWGLYHAAIYRIPTRYLTFVAVLLGWVIFRATDLNIAFNYLGRMFSMSDGFSFQCGRMPLLLIIALFITEWRMGERPHPFAWEAAPGWARSVCNAQPVRIGIYLALLLVTLFCGGASTQFIYFQF